MNRTGKSKTQELNAMIFAAGLGTRLQPLTDNKPKALVELFGKPLLWYAISQIRSAGIKRIVVNVHHFASQIEDYIKGNDWGDCEILISDEREHLLDTGGGLLNASSLFIPGQPIILYNADIICDFNLTEMINDHFTSDRLATLLVKQRKTSRYLLFDPSKQMVGWENIKTGEKIESRECNNYNSYGFCGIHIVDFDILNKLGRPGNFSIVKSYLNLAGTNAIHGYLLPDEYHWFDVGSIEKLETATKFLKGT
ncbi:nucleotidyltransferase family protein [Marinilabiliaceae bacterium JC017]|nr:nucleotidyltransferase family protein [Marinilabiliaceae bacterium JC017]